MKLALVLMFVVACMAADWIPDMIHGHEFLDLDCIEASSLALIFKISFLTSFKTNILFSLISLPSQQHGIEMAKSTACVPVPEDPKWTKIKFTSDMSIAVVYEYTDNKCTKGEVATDKFVWGICDVYTAENRSAFWTWAKHK